MTEVTPLADGMREFYIRSHRLMDRLMKAQGTSFARMRLLYFVQTSGTVRSVDIGEALGYAPRTVTLAIDALEQAGLLQRVSDSGDRRVKHISVTKAGAKLIKEAEPIKQMFVEQVFSVLEPSEAEGLQRIVAKLNDNLDRIMADGNFQKGPI